MSEVEVVVKRSYKLDLIDDLASGKYTKANLARKYGFGNTYIGRFADRYRIQIEARRELLGLEGVDTSSHTDNKLAEWIDDPEERVAYYERIFEAHFATVADPKSARICMDCLKGAAEELGQLPQRRQQAPQQHALTMYVVEGVNPEDAV